MAIPPATLTTLAVPAAITEEAMTSGAGMGISPKNGILNVAIVSSLGKISVVVGRLFCIVSGFNCCTPSVDDALSSSEVEEPS
tara:strand:+ start:6337 stop:6585 length:249 start_codon:yes stop_codon:yes gene_type:complete